MRRRWLPWIVFVAMKPPTAILPNGTELSLLTVTHGSNHIFFPGGMWQKLVYRFAPAKGISFSKFKILPIRPMGEPWLWSPRDGSVLFPDKVVVWLGHRGSTNARPLPIAEGQWFSEIRTTLADEKGEQWDMLSSDARFRYDGEAPLGRAGDGLRLSTPRVGIAF